jgi:hypothetical protein
MNTTMRAKSTVTTPTAYIAALDEPRRSEIKKLDALIRKTAPKLKRHISAGMLGYGPVTYRYASGREGEWFKIGLASQKNYISLYMCAADDAGYVAERYKERLPKASIGKSCVRFKKVEDLDRAALIALIKETAKGKLGL